MPITIIIIKNNHFTKDKTLCILTRHPRCHTEYMCKTCIELRLTRDC